MLIRFLIEAFLQVIILVPLAIVLVKKRVAENYWRIIFFALIYILYQIVLVLPRLSESLNLIGGNWNWDGKLFGILFGILCYFVFKKYFRESDFFTVRQHQDNFKKILGHCHYFPAVSDGDGLFFIRPFRI